MAITQNYCSSANLAKVLKFLEAGSADLVSGCAQTDRGSLHARFMQALQTQQPEVSLVRKACIVCGGDEACSHMQARALQTACVLCC